MGLWLLLIVVVVFVAAQDEDEEWTVGMLIPEGYDPKQPPSSVDKVPTKVSIRMNIFGFVTVSESEQSMTIDILYQQKWTDSRLAFPPQRNETISIDLSYIKKVTTVLCKVIS